MKKNFSAEAIRKLDFVLIGSRLEFLLDITFSDYFVLDVFVNESFDEKLQGVEVIKTSARRVNMGCEDDGVASHSGRRQVLRHAVS